MHEGPAQPWHRKELQAPYPPQEGPGGDMFLRGDNNSMDTTALDAVPELYRQTLAAIDGLRSLIAARGQASEIVFAAAELADFRAAFERAAGDVICEAAGIFATTRRQSLREGAARRDAELAAARETGQAVPPLRLVAS